MNDKKETLDIWSAGTVLLWLGIFMAGLFPETVFYWLRETGLVATQRALINSPWMITLSCAGFLGWFSYRRCIESNDAADVALGKSVQIVILGLAAFLPLHIEQLSLYLRIPIAFYRNVILLIIACKALSWFYLLSLLLRYHLLTGHNAFKQMPLLFPSALYFGKSAPDDQNANHE